MQSERKNIVFLGRKGVGKVSLINSILKLENEESTIKLEFNPEVPKQLAEIRHLGPVILTDTPAINKIDIDGSFLLNKIIKEIAIADFAILVLEADKQLSPEEKKIINYLKEIKLPFLTAVNKIEFGINPNLLNEIKIFGIIHFEISCKENVGIDSLLFKVTRMLPVINKKNLVKDLIGRNEVIVLVIPLSPDEDVKRFVLLQIQTIKEVISSKASVIVTHEEELQALINNLRFPPSLVIGTSQSAKRLIKILPEDFNISTYSILIAKYRNNLPVFIKALKRIKQLNNNDKVLIVESCLSHEYDDGIDKEAITSWLKVYTQKKLEIISTNEREFPENLSSFKLIIHCGGCTLASNTFQAKIKEALMLQVPIVNYGIFIAYMNGIFSRAILPFVEDQIESFASILDSSNHMPKLKSVS